MPEQFALANNSSSWEDSGAYLRGFNVIMEVVAEGLYVGDGFLSPLWCEMPGEQYCGPCQ